MKWTVFAALLLLAVGGGVEAQSDQELIDKILLAAPQRIRADAAVVGWNADGSRVTLRPGTNGVFCWDQSDEPRRRASASRCTSERNLAAGGAEPGLDHVRQESGGSPGDDG